MKLKLCWPLRLLTCSFVTDSNFLPATCEIVRSISLLPSGLSDSRPFMNLTSLSQTPNFIREICLETIIHTTSSIRNSQQRPFPSPGFLGFFSIFFWWVLELEDCLLLLINRCRKNDKKLLRFLSLSSFLLHWQERGGNYRCPLKKDNY